MKTGVELIAEERQKQIDKHGFTGEHHVKNPQWYDEFQLQDAAILLLSKEIHQRPENEYPLNWERDWFLDLMRRNRMQRLVIAGALIAAELDRLKGLGNEEV